MANQYSDHLQPKINRVCQLDGCNNVFMVREQETKRYCSNDCKNIARRKHKPEKLEDGRIWKRVGEVWEKKRSKCRWLVEKTATGLKWIKNLDKKEKEIKPKRETKMSRARKIGEEWELTIKGITYVRVKCADGITRNKARLTPYTTPARANNLTNSLLRNISKQTSSNTTSKIINEKRQLPTRDKSNETAFVIIKKMRIYYDPTKKTEAQIKAKYAV